jgi:two-component system, NarL family, response regulator NreC
MITVGIVEDHHLVREGLACLLRGLSGLEVVGEASNGKAGVQMVEKVKPTVLLLDLILPELHGLEVIRKVRDTTNVLAVSVRADDLYVAEALKYGALGYVIKESTSDELIKAIQSVAKGERYLSRLLNERAVNRLLQRLKKGDTDPYESLTMREQLVLQLSAEGMTSAEIGAHLYISSRTVETHRANLMRKLGLKSQSDLVRLAIRKKVIPV